MIDFGLSKRFLDDAGNLVAQKEGKVGFRGSTAYASLFAHEEQELGKHGHMCMILISTSVRCDRESSGVGSVSCSALFSSLLVPVQGK